MAWPIALGALGGALIGGMFAKEANEDNRAAQEAFAQHGIRWRVADAKAAGLHPLFALGGSGASYAPSAQPIMTAAEGAQMGQSVARAFAGDQLEQAQLKLAQAQVKKTEMETLQLASDIKLQEQRASSAIAPVVAQAYPVRMPGAPDGNNLGQVNPDGSWMLPQPVPLGRVENNPPYIAGPPMAAFREWNVPGLGKVLMPDAQNFAEAMESLENPVNQAAVLAANAAHYGPGARAKLQQFFKELGKGELSRGGVGGAIHRWSIK